jgi:hypothetical protein
MDRLLSFLLFAAFFYLMMRFGCGAHMVHGNHGGHNHEGKTLRFCSKQCLDKFESEPRRYVA